MRSHSGRRLPSWLIGLVLVIVLAIASVLAFTKQLPWGDAYEVHAVFESAQNVRPSSPVRIAGVNVGEVTEVESLGAAETEDVQAQADEDAGPALAESASAGGQEGARVTMELTEDALPLHSDAQFKLRPRLFLEGNLFVDLEPGSPNADEIEDGHTFGVDQTSYSVQLDQILTTLQGDVRRDLQIFLNQFGNALVKHGGAAGFRELYRTSAPANKFTAQVNEAFLGTHPGDLGGLIKGLDRVVRGLGRNEAALQSLITNFRTFSGSFAAEDVALGQAIEELPAVLDSARPAFANLNASFPALRAFAREALPGTRSAPETLDAAIPFIEQVRRLVAKRELRGLVADLRPTVPDLARLNNSQVTTLEQTRLLASCQNKVILPFSKTPIPDPDFPASSGESFSEESPRALVGLSGESRMHDANSPLFRVLAGGGGGTITATNEAGEQLYAQVDLPIEGVRPIKPAKQPLFRPNIHCETQEPPDMAAASGPGGDTVVPTPSPKVLAKMNAKSEKDLEAVEFAWKQMRAGKPYVDPLVFSDLGERMQAKRLGLKRNDKGLFVTPSELKKQADEEAVR